MLCAYIIFNGKNVIGVYQAIVAISSVVIA